MKWYAIRTAPGAQMPKREYWAETAERTKKGYRIVSATASDHSAVELALSDRGFTYYMPAEFSAVRNRHKPDLYELRRYALLKGYLFVTDLADEDWDRLRDVPGVLGWVANHDKPVAISQRDMFKLRMFEANSRAAAAYVVNRRMHVRAHDERLKRKLVVRDAQRRLFKGRDVKLVWGDKVGREATVQAWQDQDNVLLILKTLEASTETVSVPFEYIETLRKTG